MPGTTKFERLKAKLVWFAVFLGFVFCVCGLFLWFGSCGIDEFCCGDANYVQVEDDGSDKFLLTHEGGGEAGKAGGGSGLKVNRWRATKAALLGAMAGGVDGFQVVTPNSVSHVKLPIVQNVGEHRADNQYRIVTSQKDEFGAPDKDISGIFPPLQAPEVEVAVALADELRRSPSEEPPHHADENIDEAEEYDQAETLEIGVRRYLQDYKKDLDVIQVTNDEADNQNYLGSFERLCDDGLPLMRKPKAWLKTIMETSLTTFRPTVALAAGVIAVLQLFTGHLQVKHLAAVAQMAAVTATLFGSGKISERFEGMQNWQLVLFSGITTLISFGLNYANAVVKGTVGASITFSSPVTLALFAALAQIMKGGAVGPLAGFVQFGLQQRGFLVGAGGALAIDSIFSNDFIQATDIGNTFMQALRNFGNGFGDGPQAVFLKDF